MQQTHQNTALQKLPEVGTLTYSHARHTHTMHTYPPLSYSRIRQAG